MNTPINHIVVVDKRSVPIEPQPGRLIVTAQDYINNVLPYEDMAKRTIRMVNLCQDYSYLKTGYYCSLLADARGHRCIPAISDIAHANWKRIYTPALAQLNETLNKQELKPTDLNDDEIYVFFGRTQCEPLQRFARKVFDLFRMPAMRLDVHYTKNGKWKITEAEPVTLSELGNHTTFFNEALNQYSGSYWHRTSRSDASEKYWMAILHNPDDPMPPSNAKALQKFIRLGRKLGFYTELITRRDMDSLLEYDALFIRETTAVNNHTYRFAQKAASEGIAVIDDPLSILRCGNKVYLQELMKTKGIRTPKGYFLYRRQKDIVPPSAENYPLVLKIPDGSFSRGMYKVKTAEEFSLRLEELFRKTELVLVQEFLPSDYDWRIGILGGKPLFACKYFMAKGHWQIYNHNASAKDGKEGAGECVPLPNVPEKVMRTALKACSLIGDGLYGVDLKETKDGVYVIEVNDNPNIDAGVEDRLEGDALYLGILEHFRSLIDA